MIFWSALGRDDRREHEWHLDAAALPGDDRRHLPDPVERKVSARAREAAGSLGLESEGRWGNARLRRGRQAKGHAVHGCGRRVVEASDRDVKTIVPRTAG